MGEHREYYVVAVKRHERAHFLLWFTDDTDGLVTGLDGASLLAFTADAEARAHATANALEVSAEESAYYDFDELEAWVAAPNPFRLKPDTILNAWNMLGDVACSVGNQVAYAKLLDRRDRSLYDRLFSCCDIPAMGLPVAERPSAEDCTEIAAVLRHGLACFDAALPGRAGRG